MSDAPNTSAVTRKIAAIALAKLQAGKSITKSERSALEQIEQEQTLAKASKEGRRVFDSRKHLSDSYRISLGRIVRLVRKYPKCVDHGRLREEHFPAGWISQNENSIDDDDDGGTKEELEKQRLKAVIEGIERKNERMEEHYWHEDEVSELLWAVGGPQRNWIQSIETEWPGLLENKDGEFIRGVIRKRANEFMQISRAVFEKMPVKK